MQDGILRNKSFFTLENDNVILNSIERYKENGIKDVVKLENNCVKSVLHNVKELANGACEVAKEFGFDNGKLGAFVEGYKKLADGSCESAKQFWFYDGKLGSFIEGYKQLADGTCEYAKGFLIENGELIGII